MLRILGSSLNTGFLLVNQCHRPDNVMFMNTARRMRGRRSRAPGRRGHAEVTVSECVTRASSGRRWHGGGSGPAALPTAARRPRRRAHTRNAARVGVRGARAGAAAAAATLAAARARLSQPRATDTSAVRVARRPLRRHRHAGMYCKHLANFPLLPRSSQPVRVELFRPDPVIPEIAGGHRPPSSSSGWRARRPVELVRSPKENP